MSHKVCWELIKSGWKIGCGSIKWDPLHVACTEAAIAKSTWKNYQKGFETHKWTLNHGDFHHKNILWDTKQNRIVLIDWELTGIERGPVDLAVFMGIMMDTEIRKAHEAELLLLYYERLISSPKV